MKNLEGGPFGEIFGQRRSAEKCKKKPFGILKYNLFQNIETNERGPFGAIQKYSKKSL